MVQLLLQQLELSQHPCHFCHPSAVVLQRVRSAGMLSPASHSSCSSSCFLSPLPTCVPPLPASPFLHVRNACLHTSFITTCTHACLPCLARRTCPRHAPHLCTHAPHPPCPSMQPCTHATPTCTHMPSCLCTPALGDVILRQPLRSWLKTNMSIQNHMAWEIRLSSLQRAVLFYLSLIRAENLLTMKIHHWTVSPPFIDQPKHVHVILLDKGYI